MPFSISQPIRLASLGVWYPAISNGDGSELRAPMAIAVIGDVVASTLLSLVVVPAFYLPVENPKAALRRLRGLPPHSLRAPDPAE